MSEDVDESASTRVLSLDSSCTVEDLEQEQPYFATVNGVVSYGIFVDLNETISGLIHESKYQGSFAVGDDVVVLVDEIQRNGDIAFDLETIEEYEVVPFSPDPTPVSIASLSATDGAVTVLGRVVQIKQTAGPTIFSLTDGERVIGCAAFEAAGIRAYPNVSLGDCIEVRGTPERHDGGLQLEVEALRRFEGREATEQSAEVDERIEQLSTVESLDPLVTWSALELLLDDLEVLATHLRRMVLENRPILIRHHADGDGMCAAVPVAIALERFAEAVHCDVNAPEYLISRSPSKAPYYEMEDATRDLNRALAERDRHGQRLPMLLMLDNGSTAEDVPAYRNLAHYDIPIAVVDHHHPDTDVVSELLTHHINPYLVGEDYRLTTGMLCVELARMIDPDGFPGIAHVPAIAGITDRSESAAMTDYLDLANEAGCDREAITQAGTALDFAAHWLKYRSGDEVVRPLLGLESEPDGRHRELVATFAERADAAIAEQLSVSLPHVTTRELESGVQLHQLDVDQFAHRFQYPAPGKTTGAIHDELAADSGEPTITMGFGPDFCVLRSDGVRLDIPEMVTELREELPGGGVHGGGHLVVGSVKFVPGRRDDVLEALIEKMSTAQLDSALTSTRAMPDQDD